MVRVHGANDDTSLSYVVYLHYIQTRTPKGGKSTVQRRILVHPNATYTDDWINRMNTRESTVRTLTYSFYSPQIMPLRPTNTEITTA